MEVSAVLIHYTEYINFIETILDDENNYVDLDSYGLMESLIADNTLKGRIPSHLSNEFKVIGKGSYGLVVTSLQYPDTVYKWYFDEFDGELLSEAPSDYKYIGYNYPTDNTFFNRLPKVYSANDIGVLMEKVNGFSADYLLKHGESEYQLNEQAIENKIKEFANFHIELLSKGYFIMDLTDSNIWITLNGPTIIDLDLFIYSDTIKWTMASTRLTPSEKFKLLSDKHLFSYSPSVTSYIKEALGVDDKAISNAPVKINTDPLA